MFDVSLVAENPTNVESFILNLTQPCVETAVLAPINLDNISTGRTTHFLLLFSSCE